MSKRTLAEQIQGALAKKLGHFPTVEETLKELNGIGLIETAKQIYPERSTVTFEDAQGEIYNIAIPQINGKVRCSECLSYDKWEHVDHEWTDDDRFEFIFKCNAAVSPSGNFHFETCDNRKSIIVDEKYCGCGMKIEAHDVVCWKCR